MEKIYSIRKGRIWLNVFRTDGSGVVASVNKTYMDKNGAWQRTSFLNPKRGDIQDLMEALREFEQGRPSTKAQGGLI
jgi:hypothetical protein